MRGFLPRLEMSDKEIVPLKCSPGVFTGVFSIVSAVLLGLMSGLGAE